jgi:hypothetical protein
MDESLHLRPGQAALTAAQIAEAERFADARIREQLSTEPVDEPAAEALLAEAYAAAGLPPPEQVYWLDGPLHLVAALTPPGVLDRVKARLDSQLLERVAPLARDSGWDASAWWGPASPSVWMQVRQQPHSAVLRTLDNRGLGALKRVVAPHIYERVDDALVSRIQPLALERIVAASAAAWKKDASTNYGFEAVWRSWTGATRDSVWAYEDAPSRALSAFFHAYYAPNALHALDQFSLLVSGYWLGKTDALIVRRPRRLTRDGQGLLHNADGMCMHYRDGWGFYAWHGVLVPKRVIRAPETLSRINFLRERNAEARRVIQERMGERFMSELGGMLLDAGPRGTLYEVEVPGDPERVVRYLQVRDASTAREYFLRVPLTVHTAEEAVAWTFGLAAGEYHPERET